MSAGLALTVDVERLARFMPLVLVLDGDGHVLATGQTLRRVAGDITGRSFFDVFDVRRPRGIQCIQDLADAALDNMHLHLKAAEGTTFRAEGISLNGQNRGFLFNLSFGLDIAQAVVEYGLTLSDFAVTDMAVELLYLIEAKHASTSETRDLIARLEEARSDAEARSMTDSLTGLPNRRGFEQHVRRLAETRACFAVMAIDLDHFKAVNDQYGHAVGDAVLREASARMQRALRQADIVARVGGDEFLAILRQVDDPDGLSAVGERLIAVMRAPIVVDGIACHIGASVGIALTGGDRSEEAGAMIDRADAALYASKKAGRGRVTRAAYPVSDGVGQETLGERLRD